MKAEIRVTKPRNTQGCQQTTRSEGRGMGQILPPNPQTESIVSTPWSWSSSLWNCETIYFYCVTMQSMGLRSGSLSWLIQAPCAECVCVCVCVCARAHACSTLRRECVTQREMVMEGLHLPYCPSSSVEEFGAIFKSLAWDFVEGLS